MGLGCAQASSGGKERQARPLGLLEIRDLAAPE
jgi:hypothetical protein